MTDKEIQTRLLSVWDASSIREQTVLTKKLGLTREKIVSGDIADIPEITVESIRNMEMYYIDRIKKKRDTEKKD